MVGVFGGKITRVKPSVGHAGCSEFWFVEVTQHAPGRVNLQFTAVRTESPLNLLPGFAQAARLRIVLTGIDKEVGSAGFGKPVDITQTRLRKRLANLPAQRCRQGFTARHDLTTERRDMAGFNKLAQHGRHRGKARDLPGIQQLMKRLGLEAIAQMHATAVEQGQPR